MFIEHNAGAYFLVKKLGQRKLSIKMGAKDTVHKTLTDITQKEFAIVVDSPPYQTFEKSLHNKVSLKEVVFQSFLHLNTIELSRLVGEKSPFYAQAQALQH
jgi:hypothetical protein